MGSIPIGGTNLIAGYIMSEYYVGRLVYWNTIFNILAVFLSIALVCSYLIFDDYITDIIAGLICLLIISYSLLHSYIKSKIKS